MAQKCDVCMAQTEESILRLFGDKKLNWNDVVNNEIVHNKSTFCDINNDCR